MQNPDATIACRDCGTGFIFTARQQAEFKKRGFNPPNRCPECHEKRNARRRYSRGGDTQTHTAPCSTCGKEAVVPFNPSADKPVYCDACYKLQQEVKPKHARKEFTPRKPDKIQAASGSTSEFVKFDLDKRIHSGIREAGFVKPTPVQDATIPIALARRDLIGTAQTGTGKTAAFVLPILHYILNNPSEQPCTRAIVLTPTRELAEQINDTFRKLGKHTKIRSATVYGGVGMAPQERALRDGTEVIVACPGRLLDHIDRGNTNFRNVDTLILDEADRMLDMGFLPPIKRILGRLPRTRQTMLFSATFAEELNRLASDNMNNPERIDVDLRAPAKTVAHALYPCPQHLKTPLVLKILERTDADSILIFIRTKHRANRVAQQIEKAGYSTAALHSNKSQNQRQSALDDFRSGRSRILVATDIAARGLDVETISHVINYDIPDTADTYIHRIGRTGRAERTGDAITLVTKEDAAVVWEIERTLGGEIERCKLDDFDYTTPPATNDEFKRGPAPSRARKSDHSTPKSERQAKTKSPKTPGYFASRRQAQARRNGEF